MPFCGFNTWPSYCALVSPAISSNLVTLDWILCMGPSVLWERHTLFSQQRGYSGVVAFWIAPHLTSPTRTAGVTFHFLLAAGKRSIPKGGWLPSPLCCHAATHPPRMVDSCYGVNRWSRSRNDAPDTHAHTHSDKTLTSYIHNHSKMESWAPDLLLSFNLLADIPLVGNTLDFQSILFKVFFSPPLFQTKQLLFWKKLLELQTGSVLCGN